jgi:hypothetical protein
VQPISQLDEDDAHVARHRQQHFAEIFRLRVCFVLEFELVELGYAIDQLGHRFAEQFANFGFGGGRVFHHVVQQRRHQCLRIKMPLCKNAGDGNRMVYVSFPLLRN